MNGIFFILRKFYFYSLFLFVLFFIACSSVNTLTNDSSEPAWVNDMQKAREEAKSKIVAVGSYKVLSNNIDYAMNIASASARSQIANSVKANLQSVVKQVSSDAGSSVKQSNLSAIEQRVTQSLPNTHVVKRWIDKTDNILYVLIMMDEGAYEKALIDSFSSYGVDSSEISKITNAMQEAFK